MSILVAEVIGFTFLVIAFLIISRPRSFSGSSHDLLICAAHSDDCVIMGAEMAYRTLRDGRMVNIVYLTCSGPSPDSEISRRRATEAIEAWTSNGVPEGNIHFINLPESAVSGPLAYPEEAISTAAGFLTSLMEKLPANAVVLLPAEGELHVDHRSTRRAAIMAATQISRDDLNFFETPEYNLYLSMCQDVIAVFNAMLRSIPFVEKLGLKKYRNSAVFPSGSSGSIFRDTPKRLQLKLAMFNAFTSQDPNLMRAYFGYRARYRRIADVANANIVPKKRFFRLFGNKSDTSVLLVYVFVLMLAFQAAYQMASSVANNSYMIPVAFAPAATIGAIFILSGLSLIGFCRKRLEFTAGTLIAVSGLILGSI